MTHLKSEKIKNPSEISSRTFCIDATPASEYVSGSVKFIVTILTDKNIKKYFSQKESNDGYH